MSGAALKALQAAVYLKLSGNAPLMSVVNGIYDFVPETAELPYVLIEELQSEVWSILHHSAFVCTLVLDVYSDHQGHKEVQAIAGTLLEVLHEQPLIVSGWDVAQTNIRQTESERMRDGVLRRARVEIRVWLKEV